MLRRLIRSFGVEHQMLEQFIVEFRHILSRDRMDDVEALLKLRKGFGHLLTAHLHGERWVLYPHLLRSGDAETMQAAIAFEQETCTLIQVYEEHKARWLPEAIRADWDGYRAAAVDALNLLAARIAREDAELYPLALRAGRCAAPSLHAA